MSVHLKQQRWTRDDCVSQESAGRLPGRYELIDGNIVVKSGETAPHSVAVMRVIAAVLPLFGPERVRAHFTIEVAADDQKTNLPEPDVLVLHAGADGDRVLPGSDVALIVEVSDTTQCDDFGFKVGLYARAAVAEYWVLDLPRCASIAFRNPDATAGAWTDRREFTESEGGACEAAPDRVVAVAALLP